MHQTMRKPVAASIDHTKTEGPRAAEGAKRRLRVRAGIRAGNEEQAGNEDTTF